ncbi:MAG: sigma 54-interacting transcriptional regulator [Deltaproteobacteria bacterium]|nr:sigma 54-interacting transcriptional regulator [Deltaproteobacteria bacterium]
MSSLDKTQRDDLSAPPDHEELESALYVALEGHRPRVGGLRAPLGAIDEVRLARGSERTWVVEGRVATLTIPDPKMSGRHARLVREDDAFVLEDLGSTNGTYVDGKRITSAAIEDSAVITVGSTALLVLRGERVPAKTARVNDASMLGRRPRGFATIVPAVDETLPRLTRVAMSKLPVLLLGESGAGKEVVARSIHELSARTGPFVPINCGALAPTLVESQLFGYVKGAFSGALKDEPGLVRAAHGGTLFLDEIGELPAPAQATLLRVLQEHEVLPVGATKAVPVDLRVVAATLKPIDGDPSFRADLYSRIAGYVHRLVPLRERRGDLGLLVSDLLPRVAPDRADRLVLASDLVTALVMHAFPLNIRELEHLLSVASVTTNEDSLRLADTGDALKGRSPRATGPMPAVTSSKAPRPTVPEDGKLREELVRRLEETKGNVSEVARAMSTTRVQIHRWAKRLSLDIESYRR